METKWDNLILPEATKRQLLELADRAGAGGGVTALFSGASGTGKTMAAEVLAGALGRAVFKFDVANVVSKYIGETEKNLESLFAAAGEAGGVLLFDEADALFGKRTEVRDSHDRFANLEVSYLLQALEDYRGVVILTTNRRENIDPAFLQRLYSVIELPFPDAAARERIWRQQLVAARAADIDYGRLARLALAGGTIRNVAVAAGWLAARDDSAVGMTHLLDAARRESSKLGQPFPQDEGTS